MAGFFGLREVGREVPIAPRQFPLAISAMARFMEAIAGLSPGLSATEAVLEGWG